MADPTPPNQALQVLSQARTLWTQQPARRKTLAIVVVLGVLGAIAWTTFARHGETWAVVSDGVSPDDAHDLLAALQARELPARLKDGKVETPTDRVDEARAIAAGAGLPRTGKGFELFDGSSLGQSSFTEQVNYRRALQGELARSIAALAQVDTARVHLALGKRSVFKDQDEAASASVALHLHAGQTLSAEQVRGVRQLVAASVDGLKAEAVVVVDNHGNLLDASDPTSLDHKAAVERTVTARVRSMLEKIVGAGKVSVVATAEVDDQKVSETSELYDQEHPVLRSESRTVEGDGAVAGVGGVAGTRGNLPGAAAAAPTPSGAPGQRLQETKNYEVSRTVRQTTKAEGVLKRLHLAVVVDYKTGADGKPAPRTEKELAEITAIARQAAGIDDTRGDKVEVRSVPFVIDPDATAEPLAARPDALPPLPVLIAAGGGLLFVIVVVLILVLRRGRRQRRSHGPLALPAPVSELERSLEARPSLARGAYEHEAPGLPPGRPVRDRLLETVRNDVERTAGVLTAWLSESPPKGAKS